MTVHGRDDSGRPRRAPALFERGGGVVVPGFNAVLKATHLMIGTDLHKPWPPGSAAESPVPAPYLTLAPMNMGPGVTTRFTRSVLGEGVPAMIRGTDIGTMIPHFGPPSLTLPVDMLLSGSKSHFGASSVRVKDQFGAAGNLASALLGPVNPNLNCGAPSPTPFGMVYAPTTVRESLAVGDVVTGAYLMAFDHAAQTVMAKVGEMVGRFVGETAALGTFSIAARLRAGLLRRTVARQLARALGALSNVGPPALTLRARAELSLAAKGLMADSVARFLTVFALGSPIGTSLSNVRSSAKGFLPPAFYDGVVANQPVAVEGSAAALGQTSEAAIMEYLESPSVEDVPSAPFDAGVPGGVPEEAPTGGDAASPSPPGDQSSSAAVEGGGR